MTIDFEKAYNQLKQQNDLLVAQLDAHKGLLNEQLQAGINLRTNLILFQKNLQESASKNKQDEENIKQLSKDLEDIKKLQENQNASDKKPK